MQLQLGGALELDNSPGRLAMAPMALLEMHENGLYGGIGPHPSFVQVAKPFVFEQTVQRCRGDDEARETASRMQGVHWIDGVRKALNL